MSKGSSQVITCKGIVCWGKGEAMKVEEIQVDPPKPSEVRVKLLCSSVCHSDILSINGFPTFSHEGVGVVESIGEEVNGIKIGDIVIPTYVAECQTCENCITGQTNLCLKYPLLLDSQQLDGTSRMPIKGQSLYHAFGSATWCEYSVIHAKYAVKVDPSTPLSHASFLSCGYSTGFGAAWKVAKVKEGSSVAVLGLGTVGLAVVEGARIQGARKIIGIDKNSRKNEKGLVLGMTDFINNYESDKSISESVGELTGGKGVDYSFECTGDGPLLNEAIESTKLGKGKTILIGLGDDLRVQADSLPLICGRTVKGCAFGSIKTSDLPILFEKSKNKEIHLDELSTHEVELEDINKAFEMVKEPDCVKVVVKF